MGLLRDGVLLAGDALLSGITPNVGLWPASAPDPLAEYLESLALIVEIAPQLALSGHGERILDPPRRAAEIVEHHDDRLARTLAALGSNPRSGYDVCRTLFPDALAPSLRRFALAETLAHLEHLVHAHRVTRVEADDRIAYAA
jgi:glyoxylase-like metal-dependent hydrolase (beta-lactamase superfamily II)